MRINFLKRNLFRKSIIYLSQVIYNEAKKNRVYVNLTFSTQDNLMRYTGACYIN